MSDTPDLEARLAAMEARLQQLEDDRAIRDVLSRYGFTADTCKDEAFVNLYTEDGAIKVARSKRGEEAFGGSGMVEWLGQDGVRAFITHPQGHHRPELYGKSMHLQGNNLVTYIDGDEAVANSYQVALVRTDTEVKVVSAGNNQWELRRVDGQWRIKERRGAYLGDDLFNDNMDATPE